MTPQFALVLSVGGVRLLKRAASGWDVFGSVPLDSETLSETLSEMREKAQADLGSDARLPVKLVLPNDQIRYLKLDQVDAAEDDVRAALDAATSYDVDELRYDFQTAPEGTHVAAVALEALQEAEEFARDNNFLPLGFTAAAPEGTFDREVFFGVTREGRAVWLTAGPEDAPVRETESAGTEADVARDALAPGAAAAMVPAASANIAPETPEPGPTVAPKIEEEAAMSTAPAETTQGSETEAERPGAVPPPVDPAEKRRTPLMIAGVVLALLLAALLAWFLLRDGGEVERVTETPIAPLVEEPLVINADVEPAAPESPSPAQDAAPELMTASEAPSRAPETPEAPEVEPEAAPAQVAAPEPVTSAAVRQVLSRDEALRNYAATGVWQRAPLRPSQPVPSAAPLELPAPLGSAAEPARPAQPDPDIGLQREASPANPDQPRPDPAIASTEASDYTGPPVVIPPARPGSAASSEAEAVALAAPENPEAPADEAVTDTEAEPIPEPAFASAPDVAIPPRPAAPEAEVEVADDGAAGTEADGEPQIIAALPETETEAETETETETETVVIVSSEPDNATSADAEPDAATDAPAPEEPRVASLTPPDLRPAPRPSASASAPAETAPVAASFEGARPTSRPAAPTPEADPATVTEEATSPEAPTEEASASEPIETALETAEEPDPFATATPLAVASAERPASQRPGGFSRTVERARAEAAAARARAQAARAEQAAAAQRTQTASAAASAPATVQTVRPSAPSAPAASNAATQENAIDLSRIALIGVFGAPRDRRAHVRLANGRIVVVRAGDSLDGGRVAAIEKNTVTYTRGGRTVRLPMPGG